MQDVVKEMKLQDLKVKTPTELLSFAEEVGVDCTLWKPLRTIPCLSFDFASEELRFLRRQEPDDLRQHRLPPGESPRIGHARRVRLSAKMHTREHRADRAACGRSRHHPDRRRGCLRRRTC